MTYCSCHNQYGDSCRRIGAGILQRLGKYEKARDLLSKQSNHWCVGNPMERDGIYLLQNAFLNEKSNSSDEGPFYLNSWQAIIKS